MPAEAFITPQLLQWARKRSDLTPTSAAQMFKVPLAKWDAWEDGSARPTFSKAQDIARRLHVPFCYLFLSDEPDEHIDIPDLRTLTDEPPTDASPDLIDVVEDAQRKQGWFRQQRQQEGASPLSFVGRYSVDDSYVDVAHDIRTTIGLTMAARHDARNWEAFLTGFASLIESAGILVLRNGVVGNDTTRSLSVEEFRGFALVDEFVPLIFVNGADAKSAQIFTLAHELAHVWIDKSGISNPDYSRSADDQANRVERFSNRVAAELLLPEGEFKPMWNGGLPIRDNLRALVTLFRVSEIVALRHARDLDLIDRDEFVSELVRMNEDAAARPPKPPGGNFYNTLLARNSPTLATAVMSAVRDSRITPGEAATLLQVKLRTLNNVALHTIGVPLDG